MTRIEELQLHVAEAKAEYATALELYNASAKTLEDFDFLNYYGQLYRNAKRALAEFLDPSLNDEHYNSWEINT